MAPPHEQGFAHPSGDHAEHSWLMRSTFIGPRGCGRHFGQESGQSPQRCDRVFGGYISGASAVLMHYYAYRMCVSRGGR